MQHITGYAALAREEAVTVSIEVAKRAAAWGVAAFCAVVFVLFAGIAMMLGGMHGEFHWVLVVVPGIVAAVGIGAVFYARLPLPAKPFSELRSQLDADVQAWHTLGARS